MPSVSVPPVPVPSVSVPVLLPTSVPSAAPTAAATAPPVTVPTPLAPPNPLSTPAPAPIGGAGAAPSAGPSAPLLIAGQPTPAAPPTAGSSGGGRQESKTSADGPAGPSTYIAEAFDTPLGAAPPVAGILLLLLSVALAIRRHVRQADRDRRLEAAKVQFLKVASHELRTPLTVIRGYVSMAADGSLGALPEGMRTALPSIESEVNQLERLVEQMLLAARLDEQVLFLDRRRVDLRDVVRACLSGLPDPTPGTPRHRLVVETGPRPVPVDVDPNRVADVLGNLVDNAFKYSPDGGRVLVRVDSAGARARLIVADDGLGIADRDMETLFTRFGRIVNAENSHIFGSGLGLYLARELARMHGGDIKAASTAGRGSIFTVTLPLAVSPLARLAATIRRDTGLSPSPSNL